MSVVWVVELDFKRSGVTGFWMGVHHTREGAREAVVNDATDRGLADLAAEALRQDESTADQVSSSAFVRDGDRELSYVINRHVVQP